MQYIAEIAVLVSGLLFIAFAMSEHRRYFARQLESRGRVYELLNKILQRTSAVQVMVFKTENGGGRPRLNGHIYKSCMYEDFLSPLQRRKDEYQRLLLDGAYNGLLMRIDPGGALYTLDDEAGTNMLSRIMARDGVAAALFFPLHETRKEFLFLYVATNKEGTAGLLADDKRLDVELIAREMADLFRRDDSISKRIFNFFT